MNDVRLAHEKDKSDFISSKVNELTRTIDFLQYKQQTLNEKQKKAKLAMVAANIYTVAEIKAKFNSAKKEYKNLSSINNTGLSIEQFEKVNLTKAKELKEKVLDKEKLILDEYVKRNSETLNKYEQASQKLLELDDLINETKIKQKTYAQCAMPERADNLIWFFEEIKVVNSDNEYQSLNNVYQSLNNIAEQFDDVAREAGRIVNISKNKPLELESTSPVNKLFETDNSLSS